MSENFLTKGQFNQLNEKPDLKAQIKALNHQLELVEKETAAFVFKLRTILIDLIIEEQELSDLYRRMQKAKKEKRLEQKKRGKNYTEPQGIIPIAKKEESTSNTKEERKELKRLYREAMLQVHPDKFSMHTDKLDLATEITSKLIEIYRSGNLKKLQLFHAHIFSGHALDQTSIASQNHKNALTDDLYLKHQIDELEHKLKHAKNKVSYRVLKDYQNPMHFADELKDYYEDRLFKLRKRTRKAYV